MKHGRLTWFEPETMTREQRALYDRIASGPRASGPQAFSLVDPAGRLEGPFNAFLLAPEIGAALQELGSALRYRSSLAARLREIAVLEVAALRRSEFEWYAHERVGLAAGLSEDEVAALKTGTPAPTLDARESAVRDFVRSLVEMRDADAPLLERLEVLFEQRELMELIALVGYYDLLALSLRVWRTPLPAGATTTFENDAPSG